MKNQLRYLSIKFLIVLSIMSNIVGEYCRFACNGFVIIILSCCIRYVCTIFSVYILSSQTFHVYYVLIFVPISKKWNEMKKKTLETFSDRLIYMMYAYGNIERRIWNLFFRKQTYISYDCYDTLSAQRMYVTTKSFIYLLSWVWHVSFIYFRLPNFY